MDVRGDSTFLERMAKGIAALFGSNCEVAIHDLSRDSAHTIAAIENGHVTNRKVGDDTSEIVLQALKTGGNAVQDQYNYLTRSKEGRIFKSASIYIRDGEGKAIGLVGINYDISELMMASAAIGAALHVDGERKDEAEMNAITPNVNDLLDQLIEESVRNIGKPVALMSKEEKVRAIHYLDGKGAFLIKKSGDKVSGYFDISKYTLYNYMDAEA